MDKRYEDRRQTSKELAKKPTFGEALDEMRRCLGRIEMHVIDIKEKQTFNHEWLDEIVAQIRLPVRSRLLRFVRAH